MTVLKHPLHRRADSLMMNEDWWHLVFDRETGRLFVEHEWAHTNPKSGESSAGTEEVPIKDYFNADWRSPSGESLTEFLARLFAGGKNA